MTVIIAALISRGLSILIPTCSGLFGAGGLFLFSLEEPSTNNITLFACVILGTALEEKICLLTVYRDSIAIPTAAGLQSSGREYINDPVNIINRSIFPCKILWQHFALIIKRSENTYIDFRTDRNEHLPNKS